MQLLDPAHPFFRPLWRRVLIVALSLGWAVFEFAGGAPFWGVLFAAAGLYCAWMLLIAYVPPPDGGKPEKEET